MTVVAECGFFPPGPPAQDWACPCLRIFSAIGCGPRCGQEVGVLLCNTGAARAFAHRPPALLPGRRGLCSLSSPAARLHVHKAQAILGRAHAASAQPDLQHPRAQSGPCCAVEREVPRGAWENICCFLGTRAQAALYQGPELAVPMQAGDPLKRQGAFLAGVRQEWA